MSHGLRARTLSLSEISLAEIARWDALCRSNPAFATPFLSFAFARAAAQVFDQVRVCVIERSGIPEAFFPFQFASPLRRLLGFGERVAGELSDYFGVVAPPDLRIRPQQLLSLAGLNAMLFTHLDNTQQGFGLIGEQPQIGLRIVLDRGGDAYWQARRKLDKHFVADTERCWRKLRDALGTVDFAFNQADWSPHLDELMARKRDQYARTNVFDPLADPKAREFLRALATTDDPLCRGVMSTLHAGGIYAASHFGLVCGATFHYWFPVYDPRLRSYAPGRLLLRALIGEADRQEIRRIDMGVGDTPAKRDFANEENLYLRGLWHLANPQAVAIRAWQSLRWRWAANSSQKPVRGEA